jgi:Protein of unknown function (DUF4065)
MAAPDREKAKRLILEIIRQSGGGLGKTQLFKAFWLSHLYYAKTARGFLTDWRIVRMPHGPGIDEADDLLQELVQSGFITQTHEAKGPYTQIHCSITGKEIDEKFSTEAIQAIQAAVGDVKGQSAGSISQWSHEFSRSWNNTPNGTELDIYADLIPDDVYNERRKKLTKMKKVYEDLFE